MCLGQYEELSLGAGLVAHWWTQQAYIKEGGMALGKRMSGGAELETVQIHNQSLPWPASILNTIHCH